MSAILFLAWAPYSVRAESISRRLDASLHTLSYKTRRKLYSPIKYPLLFYKTLRVLTSSRPATIICQSPPIFCPGTAMLYAATARKNKVRIIIDAHTATFERPWSLPILKTITKRVMRKAIAVIVANAELQNIVYQNYGIMPVVLEDGVPQLDKSRPEASQMSNDSHSNYTLKDSAVSVHPRFLVKELENEREKRKFKIAVICSFASDEPIEEIIEAAKILSETTTFLVTGDSSRLATKLLSEWKETASNVMFTGFLDDREYVELLKKVDAVMVLSRRYHNMLSGAHEALALEMPLITSDWPPLRKYFSAGTAYVNNSVKGIVGGINYVQLEKDRMKEEMRNLKKEKLVEWEHKISAFKDEFIEGNERKL